MKNESLLVGVSMLMLALLVGCGEDEKSTVTLNVDNQPVELVLYGWWADSDTAQIITFSTGGGSYQSDHPSVWIQFPKLANGSYSEGTPNVELQYWDEAHTFYRTEGRGSCNISVTGTDPLTGTFGGVVYSSAMIPKNLQGSFSLLTSDYQGIR